MIARRLSQAAGRIIQAFTDTSFDIHVLPEDMTAETWYQGEDFANIPNWIALSKGPRPDKVVEAIQSGEWIYDWQ